MKKGFFILFLFFFCFQANARHVAGGELFYEYLGVGPNSNTSLYRITLRLFRDCASSGPLLQNEPVTVGIYENSNLVVSLKLPISTPVSTISLNTSSFPCLVGSVNVCYETTMYSETVVLSNNQVGYTLSRIGCCRVDRISNLSQPLNVGSNYVTEIPGKLALSSGHNSSPQFLVKDTALVCANKSFKLDFGAIDPDNDSLTYSFCEAYTSSSGSNNVAPPQNISLISLPYQPPYNGSFPLGSKVKINAKTGLINGIAPPEGQYVVNVCVTEWRAGKVIAQHRKDFILKVQNCDFIEAVLPDKIVQCNDFTVHFENESNSSAITSYLWNYGDPASNNNTSTNAVNDHVYGDTGVYRASLFVTGPQGCVGEDSTLVYVFPGFKPDFSITGSCYLTPFQFTDATTTKYGVVDSWLWNFGENSTDKDTSTKKNPTYLYPNPSIKVVSLVVTSSKGCIDTLHKDLVVRDIPQLHLPFHDTLICSIDTLAIPVSNTGNYTWSPNKNIIGINTSSPLVFPKDTTRYIVTINDNGCINTDTVTVNVLTFINVKLGPDTVICRSDTIRLLPQSHALSYQWTSSSGVLISNVKNPLIAPLVNTRYYVTANLGKCQARDSTNIKVVAYPLAAAGPDISICMGNRIQLHGKIVGSHFNWSPTASLLNENTTDPIAGPGRSTYYVLSVSDTLGCPKMVSDTILVTVTPTLTAFAGRDTAILVNQPLQLNATGGESYSWRPIIGLSNPNIANPIAILDGSLDSIRYVVRVTGAGGCFADDDIMVKVFKSVPTIFVPSAFTPNADGKNDVLRPILVGISELTYFRIYNRWGQLLFTSQEPGKAWDGLFKGVLQPNGTYVYATEGKDYQGNRVFRKGTVVLIR